MGYFIGALYFYLFYTSILAGYLILHCTIFPVLLVSNKLYRYLTDIILNFWQQYPSVLLLVLAGTKIEVTGQPIESNKTSIIIMNHRTRTDWNFLWPSLFYSVKGSGVFKHSTKFLLKDAIRHVPGPGWVMQLTAWIFIKRNWSMDEKTLEKFCKYIQDLSYKFSVVIYPEGTDLTEDTKRKSDSFARKNQLQEFNYVLHPRTTGFTFFCHQLMHKNCLDAVYDLTIIYPDTVPQTEKHLIHGQFPKRVCVHIDKKPLSILPKTEEDMKVFIQDLWKEKEATLQDYYTKKILKPGQPLRRNDLELVPALVFWTCLPFIAVYLLFYTQHFWKICLTHTIFFMIVDFATPGFQWFEIELFNMKKKILGNYAI